MRGVDDGDELKIVGLLVDVEFATAGTAEPPAEV